MTKGLNLTLVIVIITDYYDGFKSGLVVTENNETYLIEFVNVRQTTEIDDEFEYLATALKKYISTNPVAPKLSAGTYHVLPNDEIVVRKSELGANLQEFTTSVKYSELLSSLNQNLDRNVTEHWRCPSLQLGGNFIEIIEDESLA